MKRINKLTLLLLAMMAIGQMAQAQVTVSGSTGANATYSKLALAFTAINGTAQTGNNIVITITANTSESPSAVLNAGAWTTLKIYPTVTGLSITGNLATPLIDLNGADNVTIDGRVNATGSTKDLLIANTSAVVTAGTSTIRFYNDASANTVKYCVLKGSSMDPAAGVLFFGATTGANGNDGNLIDYNDITNSADASRPLNVVYSAGTTSKTNSGNTISNNNIYNFLNKGASSNGIQLAANNTGWSISTNSFYETDSFVPTAAAATYSPIYVSDVTSADIAISGNFIGGSAPACGTTGIVTKWTKTNAKTSIFYGIYLKNGPTVGTTTSVQGNTIKNFSWDDAGASTWYAIVISSSATGAVNIGTVTGNTIGATTGTGSITVTSAAADGNVYGISIGGTGAVNCQNNTIGAITAANSNSSYATNFYGIIKTNTAGTTTISNNTIGSTTTASSIITSSSSSSTTNAQYLVGIQSKGTGTVNISGNIVSKLTNSTINNTTSTYGRITGIGTYFGTNTIANNTVRDLTIANANVLGIRDGSVVGILQMSIASAAQTVSGNTIYNLSNTYATFRGYVTGIYYEGGSTASAVSGNFIHSLTVSSNSAYNCGIHVNQGTSTYSNNIISLAGNTAGTLYGILEEA